MILSSLSDVLCILSFKPAPQFQKVCEVFIKEMFVKNAKDWWVKKILSKCLIYYKKKDSCKYMNDIGMFF